MKTPPCSRHCGPICTGIREKRLDDAIQMMKMMKLLPLLQGKVSDE